MFKLYDLDMNEKPFPIGVHPLDIYISSLRKYRYTDSVEGANGIIDYGFVYDTRDIEVRVLLKANDTRDYRLIRDAVYSLFSGSFYVVEDYQQGKRYKVMVTEYFIPERATQRDATAEFKLDIVDLPFAESIGTTQELESNFDYRIWTEGMGLIPDNESRIYTHETTEFRIYNAGIPIHPFEQELTITIDNVEGSTEYLELENTTNGTLFKVNESVSNSQTIVLDGANITSNGLAFLRSTNKQFIELAHGWNEFQIRGATSARVSFNCRFYYH